MSADERSEVLRRHQSLRRIRANAASGLLRIMQDYRMTFYLAAETFELEAASILAEALIQCCLNGLSAKSLIKALFSSIWSGGVLEQPEQLERSPPHPEDPLCEVSALAKECADSD